VEVEWMDLNGKTQQEEFADLGRPAYALKSTI
jgi:hypothetical protein